MGRRRLQMKGDLRKMGGYWRVRWKEDQILADGSMGYDWCLFHDVGPCLGPNRMTRPQAERAVWENYLSRIDMNMRTPQSVMTFGEFVERKFLPEHVVMKKPAGRVHYASMLAHAINGIPEKRRSFKGEKMERGKWLEDEGAVRRFGLGKKRLRDVNHEDVQRLVSEAIAKGYSVQTAKHIKTCVSAVFTHAERINWFSGKNPVRFVQLPEMARRPVRALSFEELTRLLAALKPMARAMVLCASLTSMNIAEVCGLRWKRVNLTMEPVIVDGESIPPHHAAVREQWYLRQWGTVKAKARQRNCPLPMLLVEAMAGLKLNLSNELSYGELPVFAGESGRPIDQSAILKRQVRKAAAGIGAPNLGWHDLRRTFATLSDQLGLTLGERQALMGHARASQTMAYTHTPGEMAIAALERMGDKVKGVVN